jgi:hypothetical protein
MADLVITVANVVRGGVNSIPQTLETGVAGAAVTAGQVVYEDPTDGKWKLADANASQTAATVKGIALHGALANQPLQVIKGGPLTLGAILTPGQWYVTSANPGGIAPVADLASGWYSSRLGYAYSASVLIVDINATGIPLP